MEKNKSLPLDNYFEQFIEGLIKDGRYKNKREVILAGLRLLEAAEQEMMAFRKSNQLDSVGLVSDYLTPYLETSKNESKSQDLKRMKKALNARIDQSESDFMQGRFKSSTEIFKKFKWNHLKSFGRIVLKMN